MNKIPFHFWIWFFSGSGGEPGYRRIINKWILFHLLIGIIISLLVQISLQACANTVLLPLAGIFIGLSFAWIGNAQALLQSDEMIRLSKYHEGGFVEYVFAYQTAILTILTTLVLWGLSGLNIFDGVWPTVKCNKLYFAVKIILFTLSSLTLRECWLVVMGVQWMLIVKKEMKNNDK